MAKEVFKRTEKKYLLGENTYNRLMLRLGEYMVKDRYFESDIMSLYFDTPDYRLIRASLEKPVFKEKIRLRSYGVPDAHDTVFFEIKRKYKGVVYKRRSVMPLENAEAMINGEQADTYDAQIENEIKYAFEFYPSLAPKMLISYHRLALSAKNDPDVRITFDDRILFRTDRLRLSDGFGGRELLPKGRRIMEIKLPGAMPLWLSHILDELEIYPSGYSKYGSAYLTLLKEGALFSPEIIRT